MTEQKSIVDIIREYMKSGEITLPALSDTAAKLQTEITKEDPDMSKVEAYIKLDPAITGEVLRVANSSYYRGIGTVETIHDAGLRIGLSELANIIMVGIHRSKFKSKDPYINDYLRMLWKHSLACAIGSSWLSKHLMLNQLSGKAFIAGILHDMGKLFLLTALEDIKKNNNDFNPSNFLIEKMLTSLHSEQGYDLLVQWNLPQIYCIIARDHHGETFDSGNQLLAIVRLVNRVCSRIGINMPLENVEAVAGSIEVELLDLSEISLAELEIAIEDAMMKLT